MNKIFQDLVSWLMLVLSASLKFSIALIIFIFLALAFRYLDAADMQIEKIGTILQSDREVLENSNKEGQSTLRWVRMYIPPAILLAFFYSLFHIDIRKQWENLSCKSRWIYVIPIVLFMYQCVSIDNADNEIPLLFKILEISFVSVIPGVVIGSLTDLVYGKLRGGSPENKKVFEEDNLFSEGASSGFPKHIFAAFGIEKLGGFYLKASACTFILLMVLLFKKSNNNVHEIDLAEYGFADMGKLYVKQVTSVGKMYESVDYPIRHDYSTTSTEICIDVSFDGQERKLCHFKYKQLHLFFGDIDSKKDILDKNIKNIEKLEKKFNDIARKSAVNF